MREVQGNVGCVGREAELAELLELHRKARDESSARLSVLVGPAGIGKSRLLSALRGKIRLSGGVVLEGRCDSGVAFAPFAAIVTQALRFLDEIGQPLEMGRSALGCAGGCHPLWYQHKGHANPADSAEFARSRDRFFDGVARLLASVAAVRTPVVMLHDLDHADHGTFELLQALLDAGTPFALSLGRPLSALFTACVRSDDQLRVPGRVGMLLEHEAAHRINLGALNEAGIRALLTSPEAVAQILARTGGSPDAIRRLLEVTPPSHAEHVRNVLHALPEAARRAVTALALYGRPARYADLEQSIDATLDHSLRHCLQGLSWLETQIIEGEARLAFTREAEKKALVDALDPSERRRIHAGWLSVLESQGADAEDRARHALLSGDHDRAISVALEAARSLAARHAPHEAAELIESVVELAPATTDVLPLRRELSALYRVVGDYRRGLQHARALREAHPECPEALRAVGDLLVQSGDLEQANEVLRAAHARAIGLDHEGARARIEALVAEVAFRRADHEAAEHWASRVSALLPGSAADVPCVISARNTLGKIALSRGDKAGAASIFEHNRALAAEHKFVELESQALANLGFARLDPLKPLDALPWFQDALRLAEAAGDARRRAVATEALAVCSHLARDYGKAREHYQSALLLLRRVSSPAMVAGAAANLGELYLSMGEVSRAHSMCELSAQLGGTRTAPVLRAEGLVLRGRVAQARGDTTSARAAFEAARSFMQAKGDARLVELELCLTELDFDEGCIVSARSRLRDLGSFSAANIEARVALLFARIERALGDASLVAFERATRLCEASADDELRLVALTLYAQALLDAGQPHAARDAVERAFGAERRLSASVPTDLVPAWNERRARLDLERVQRLVFEVKGARVRFEQRFEQRGEHTERARKGQVSEQQFAQWAERYPKILGRSSRICDVLRLIDRAARSSMQVLVRGESGTGKELVAEALHLSSDRRDKPFVRMNCAAIVETLLLSELFGHERGAFTGAAGRRKGRFEVAHGGTLFLDEIGDISAGTQAALLRVLQEGEFERVGGTQTVKVDVRIIAATHRDLEAMVRAGTFREDLYYRLRGVTIDVPALRDRREDIEGLCTHLLKSIAEERACMPLTLSSDVLTALLTHNWPGNVRELDNVLRSASLFADDGVVHVDALQSLLPLPIVEDTSEEEWEAQPARDSTPPLSIEPGELNPIDPVYDQIRGGRTSLFEMKKQMERECIQRALSETSGNITRAASLLGMKRPRLSQLVKEYELSNLAERLP